MSMRDGGRAIRPTKAVAAALTTAALLIATQLTLAGPSTASAKTQAKAEAKKLLLVRSDMPKGWKTEKGSNGHGSNNVPGAKQLASCIGVPAHLITSNPPEADSPYFESKSGALEVQDSVSVFASPKAARTEFAAIANAKTPVCMATILNGAFKARIAASAGKGATLGTITVTRANPAGFGQGTTGIVISLPISEQGVSLTAEIVAIYYVKGKFGQQIGFNSYGSSFPTSIAKSITAAALHRL